MVIRQYGTQEGEMLASQPSRQDLQTFLRDYSRSHPDDVLVVDEEVRDEQETTAVVYELRARAKSPLLVFTNVTGLDIPVVTNLFGSRARIAAMLGTDIRGIAEKLRLALTHSIPPAEVPNDTGLTVWQEAGDVDLRRLPLIMHFEGEGGPYITSGIVIAEDPDSPGLGNASYHRAMRTTANNVLGLNLGSRGDLWSYVGKCGERGTDLPVAMVIGAHPMFMIAAAATIPYEQDERHLAGGLLGEALEVVRTPGYGIGVPAASEFVLEGVIRPAMSAHEGPAAEFTGYYSQLSTKTMFEVERVLRRRNPILLDIISGDSAEHLDLGGLPRVALVERALKERFPNVTAVDYPLSACYFHCYVSVKPGRPTDPREVLLAVMSLDHYVKLVVVVDDDVDVAKEQEVLWAVATRFQADEDLLVIDKLRGSLLDPSSHEAVTSRMGLDATRRPGFEAQRIGIAASAAERAVALLETARPLDGASSRAGVFGEPARD